MPRLGFSLATDPAPYGGLYVTSNGASTVITSASVAMQFLHFDTNTPSFNMIPDHTNDHVTIGQTGNYMIFGSVTIKSGGGVATVCEIEIKKNNGASTIGGLHADRNLSGGGGDTGSVSLSGVAALSKGDTVEVWVENETNTQNYILEDVALSLLRVG